MPLWKIVKHLKDLRAISHNIRVYSGLSSQKLVLLMSKAICASWDPTQLGIQHGSKMYVKQAPNSLYYHSSPRMAEFLISVLLHIIHFLSGILKKHLWNSRLVCPLFIVNIYTSIDEGESFSSVRRIVGKYNDVSQQTNTSWFLYLAINMI